MPNAYVTIEYRVHVVVPLGSSQDGGMTMERLKK